MHYLNTHTNEKTNTIYSNFIRVDYSRPNSTSRNYMYLVGFDILKPIIYFSKIGIFIFPWIYGNLEITKIGIIIFPFLEIIKIAIFNLWNLFIDLWNSWNHKSWDFWFLAGDFSPRGFNFSPPPVIDEFRMSRT